MSGAEEAGLGVIPVVLFAYARPDSLLRVLEGLRADRVPLLYAYSDGPRGPSDVEAVAAVRDILRNITWTDVRLIERPGNFGLGRSILDGVTEIAARHAAFLVWEDDLVPAPGTYAWLCAALRRYAKDERVFSVTGWTNDEIAPAGAQAGKPWFDGRAECWVWGGYARSWSGMDQPAWEKVRACRRSGIDPFGYGLDLALMARHEVRNNLWAVRWLLHHVEHRGWCVRPGANLIDHLGEDGRATNVRAGLGWTGELVRPPVLVEDWPPPALDPGAARRWRKAIWRRLRFRQKLAAALYRWL